MKNVSSGYRQTHKKFLIYSLKVTTHPYMCDYYGIFFFYLFGSTLFDFPVLRLEKNKTSLYQFSMRESKLKQLHLIYDF